MYGLCFGCLGMGEISGSKNGLGCGVGGGECEIDCAHDSDSIDGPSQRLRRLSLVVAVVTVGVVGLMLFVGGEVGYVSMFVVVDVLFVISTMWASDF